MGNSKRQREEHLNYVRSLTLWKRIRYEFFFTIFQRFKYARMYGIRWVWDSNYRHLMQKRRERQRRKHSTGKSRKIARMRIIKRDGYKCKMCPSTEDLTIDHIIPVGEGGLDVLENWQFLCRPCHDQKDGMGLPPKRWWQGGWYAIAGKQR